MKIVYAIPVLNFNDKSIENISALYKFFEDKGLSKNVYIGLNFSQKLDFEVISKSFVDKFPNFKLVLIDNVGCKLFMARYYLMKKINEVEEYDKLMFLDSDDELQFDEAELMKESFGYEFTKFNFSLYKPYYTETYYQYDGYIEIDEFRHIYELGKLDSPMISYSLIDKSVAIKCIEFIDKTRFYPKIVMGEDAIWSIIVFDNTSNFKLSKYCVCKYILDSSTSVTNSEIKSRYSLDIYDEIKKFFLGYKFNKLNNEDIEFVFHKIISHINYINSKSEENDLSSSL